MKKIIELLTIQSKVLGFSSVGIAGIDLKSAESRFVAWLKAGFHGEMDYMAKHGLKRTRPSELVVGTVSVITVRMDYLPQSHAEDWRDIEESRLANPSEAVISVYARGRDYHKVMRARLQTLSQQLSLEFAKWDAENSCTEPELQTRVFVDSAPVMEVELAQRSGLGWRGKHTLLLNREAGSMFFLGEIFVNRALPITPVVDSHCGACTACIDVCPTAAIVAPYQVDARRCISYLTIENKGEIPVEFRPAMGNRIYGCDDCQTVCPWNKFAKRAVISDFDVRDGMQGATLLELFAWTEAEFLKRTEGSAIRRIGFERWQRNIAVAMGNQLKATVDEASKDIIVAALSQSRVQATPLVQTHIDWALEQAYI